MEPPRSERVALSRELSEFLVELSIALHRHSMYPTGHPSLEPALDGVVRRAERLLQDRPSIALGVARRQLIIEGVATDPNQPVLRRLAEGLHRHHIGAVSILRGVQPHEVGEALRVLATEAESGSPLGFKRDGQVTSWPHVKLHPLMFDGLTIVDDASRPGEAIEGQKRSRDAELWVGLARAAMATEDVGADVATEPSVVAKAIDEHPRAEAYDQVIVGYLLQIARELSTASGDTADDLRRRSSQLIASLRPDTLRRLVNLGGDRAQRAQFVLEASHGMAVDAVIEIVKAAGEASGQSISHGLVRMLSKLAMHAEMGTELARPRADVELREQVGRLLQDWRLEDPNPETYGRVLQHLATKSQAEPAPMSLVVAEDPDPLRLVQMSLESGAFGPLADKALDEIMLSGRVGAVLELLGSRPEAATELADAFLARLTRPEMLKAMLDGDQVDLAGLDSLLPRLSIGSFGPLLDALGSSPNRAVRRRLLDRLSQIDADIGPLVVVRLKDERWFVQRNMLVLLERSGRLPEGFSPLPWTTHPDARVRCEAVRLQLRLPHERELGVVSALNDVDSRVVHLGLTAVQHDCPPQLRGRLIELAVTPDSGDEIRYLAVSALRRIRDTSVLDALLQVAHGGRSLLGRPRLPPKTPALVAALRALAETWDDDPRAASILSLAARSPDPDLREAVSPSTS
jgi:hypothetical protein